MKLIINENAFACHNLMENQPFDTNYHNLLKIFAKKFLIKILF